MKVNVHDILSYASDVVMGRKEGKDGEKGWAKGEWHDRARVCLGAALRVAEQDLVEGVRYVGRYERDLDYQPAIDAQQVLADAILKLHPELTSGTFGGLYPGSHPRDIIIGFNDAAHIGEDAIGEALELADKMVWEAELEAEMKKAHPAVAGSPTPPLTFVDYLNS